ncbi:MAG TPA: hypothetical protein VGD27_00285 [Longimicrobiales bacterium]
MLAAAASCDNVDWGGSDVAIVPPPPRADALPASGEDLGADPLPEGPLLFYVVPSGGTATMIPIGEISGDSLVPLRGQKDQRGFANRLVAAHMRRGSEFVLFRRGTRVGNLVVTDASVPEGNVCPLLPTAHGTLELSAGAEQIPEYLAISKVSAPEVGRNVPFTTEPTRNMQVIAPILAEKMIRARSAELPGNWQRAMAQLQPFPIANSRDAGFASTFVVGDELRIGGDNVGYSVFFIGEPGAQFGYDTVFVNFMNFPQTGKSAPRVVDFLDWNRDGQVDLLLQVFGMTGTWFEAVSKDQRGVWRLAFRDKCETPSATAIPRADTTRAARDTGAAANTNQ